MSSRLAITIVNRTNAKTLMIPGSSVNWSKIMDKISDLEGYASDDLPIWDKSVEYTTPTGKKIAEFTRLSDNCILIAEIIND